ncbi:MAG: hypothetical protein MK110_19235 [Fuerstiella sp.]|nr:hypothetical protein [Fuerstiella sp.]
MRVSSFVGLILLPALTCAGDSIDIGSRRELFIDQYMIQSLRGVTRKLHHPVPHDIAIVNDAPWEGCVSGYHSIVRDRDLYRMYYRGAAISVAGGILKKGTQVSCFAQSQDGIHWEKPILGLREYDGSKQNNIIWTGVGTHNFSPFLDSHPNCPSESRFKAMAGILPRGLFVFHSPDGIRWSFMNNAPVITDGAFDSQNVAFWDSNAGKYRVYYRILTEDTATETDGKPLRIRAIRTASSSDLLTWSDEADLTYEDSPVEQLYTNQIAPYPRAPHVLIGFPMRYVERSWSPSLRDLPDTKHREQRSAVHMRLGTAITETLLMASRDGVHFDRWNEAFLPPGPERTGTWNYGNNSVAWQVVETKSALPDAPNELAFYAAEGGWMGDSNAVRRYTMRLDGFVSIHAGWKGGEMMTRPLQFSGNQLSINFATSAAGSIRVEIQNADGGAIDGFGLNDCSDIFGDTVDRTVYWSDSSDVSELAGRSVVLRFVMKDADLYSFRFGSE